MTVDDKFYNRFPDSFIMATKKLVGPLPSTTSWVLAYLTIFNRLARDSQIKYSTVGDCWHSSDLHDHAGKICFDQNLNHSSKLTTQLNETYFHPSWLPIIIRQHQCALILKDPNTKIIKGVNDGTTLNNVLTEGPWFKFCVFLLKNQNILLPNRQSFVCACTKLVPVPNFRGTSVLFKKWRVVIWPKSTNHEAAFLQ